MITIYDKDATDFAGLGLGALDPSSCVVREDAGGMYELELEQPITADGRHLLLNLYNIIKAPAPVREAPAESYAPIVDSTITVTREIYKIITNKRLSLRSEPNDSTSYNLCYYDPGTLVIKLEDLGITDNYYWYEVQIVDGGEVGYMAYKAEFDGVWYDYLQFQRSETETIQGDNPGKVVVPTQARDQLFRVYSVTRDAARNSVTALAQHITYDLKGVVCTGTYTPENVSAKTVLTQVLSRADHTHPFQIYCGITQEISGDYGGRNIIDIICDSDDGVLHQTGGRLIRDNFNLYIIEDQTRDLGVRIWRGKNLLQAAMEQDCANVVTKIIPQGTDKDGEPLIGDPVTSSHISDYPIVYTKQIIYDVRESDDASRAQALQDLAAAAQKDFDENGIDMPTVNIDADFVRTELVPEFTEIATNSALHLYDTVGICAPDQQIMATLRMTAYVYDCLQERYASTELGQIEDMEPTVYGYEIGGGISGTKILLNSVPGTALRGGTVPYGSFSVAAIEHLSADSIAAVTAYVDNLVAHQITTDQLYADLAQIAVAQITTANIQNANINWATITNLTAEIASIANAQIGSADISYAKIKDLVTGTAIITEGTAGQLYISRLAVTDANMVSLTTGELMLRASDGSFVRLIADGQGGVTTQTVEVEGDNIASATIAGSNLIQNTITARELNVSSIFADQALIGAIKAANIDVADLFAAQATINQLNAYDITGNTSLSLWVPGKLNTGTSSGVKVQIDSSRFSVDVPGTNGDLRLDSEGGRLNKAIIGELDCPNAAKIYTGPGTITVGKSTSTFLSLTEAFASLNGNVVKKNVTITLEANLYEEVDLAGVSGAAGSGITVYGNGYTLYGRMTVRYMQPRVFLDHFNLVANTASDTALLINGCAFVYLSDCTIDASGCTGAETEAIYTYASTLRIQSTGLYNATNLLFCGYLAHVMTYALSGGNCTKFLLNRASVVHMMDTRPDGAYLGDWGAITRPDDPTTLRVDSGSVQPAPPTTTTSTLTCTASGHYWNAWESGNNILQGRYDNATYAGCMWFDTSAISGKTIRSATLTIRRANGFGTWASTTLYLCGTTLTGKSGNPITNAVTYSAIGSLTESTTGTLAVPVAAVQALANGTIKGLMLYIANDTNVRGNIYSDNFSAYSGYGSGNAPSLTVTYDT